MTKEKHPITITILSVTSFSALQNYNKTHKSRLKYEIKYDLNKFDQKIKISHKFWTFEAF